MNTRRIIWFCYAEKMWRNQLLLRCSFLSGKIINCLDTWSGTPFFFFFSFPGKILELPNLHNHFHLDNTWRRKWQPTPVLLPGKSHGRRSLVGCSPWGHEESDTTEWLHFHFSLSCIGEGNGNPIQCSCLENPRVGGGWWAAVYGVTQSRTRLKRLSSSSSWIIYEWSTMSHIWKMLTSAKFRLNLSGSFF